MSSDESSDEEWNQIIGKIRSTCKKSVRKDTSEQDDRLLSTLNSLHLDSSRGDTDHDESIIKITRKHNRRFIDSDDSEPEESGNVRVVELNDEATELLIDLSSSTSDDDDPQCGPTSPDLDTDHELYNTTKCSYENSTNSSKDNEEPVDDNSTAFDRSPLKDVTEEYSSSSYSTINSSKSRSHCSKNYSNNLESDQENVDPSVAASGTSNWSTETSSDEEWEEILSPRKPVQLATNTNMSKPNVSLLQISKVKPTALKTQNFQKDKLVENKTSKTPSSSNRKNFGIDFDLEKSIPTCYFSATRNKSLTKLFVNFDEIFFESELTKSSVDVAWSNKLTKTAGLFHGRRKPKFEANITLSCKLLIKRTAIDFVQTLLHEMIHAYLFVKEMRDKSAHGPNFKYHMNRINSTTEFKITIFHTFHDEVNSYKVYVWRCNGRCQSKKEFLYGYIKRSRNRNPSPSDFFWKNHSLYCDGTFDKIYPGTDSYDFAMNCIK